MYFVAFMQLDMLLRHKFPEDSGLAGLPQDPAGHERGKSNCIFIYFAFFHLCFTNLHRQQHIFLICTRGLSLLIMTCMKVELIKEFIEKVTSNSLILKTPEARSFFEVPTSKRLMDLSDDTSRSILSLPLVHIPGLKFPEWFPEITIAHCLLLLVLLGTAVPMAGVGVPPEVRPIAAGVCLVISLWQIVQPDGIIDLVLEKLLGKDNVIFARGLVRVADMPIIWMSIGMIMGSGLASVHPYSPQMSILVGLCALVGVFAFVNLLITLSLVDSRKKKRH